MASSLAVLPAFLLVTAFVVGCSRELPPPQSPAAVQGPIVQGPIVQGPIVQGFPGASNGLEASPLSDEHAPAPTDEQAAAATGAPDEAEDPAVIAGATEQPAPAEAAEAPEAAATAEDLQDVDPSAIDDFSEPLAPYGRWVEDARYGTVWVPHPSAVGSRFAPYVTRGHWALTSDNQWMWVSDYPFGWVVFHYGRWAWSSHHGWCWVAGRRYSHAWVSFRVSDDPYIGWAPMAPRWVWRSGVAVWIGTVPFEAYVYVPTRYVFYPSVHSYVVVHPTRIRHLGRHSHRYRQPGVPSHRYVSPPLERIPASARPAGRAAPDPRAIGMQRQAASVAPSRAPARPDAAAPTVRSLRVRSAGDSRATPVVPRRLGTRPQTDDGSGKRWRSASGPSAESSRAKPPPKRSWPKQRRIEYDKAASERRAQPPPRVERRRVEPPASERRRKVEVPVQVDRQKPVAPSAERRERARRDAPKSNSQKKARPEKQRTTKPNASPPRRVRPTPGAERRRVFPGGSSADRFGAPRRLPMPERSQRRYK